MMKNSKVRLSIVTIVLLILYNLIVFAIPFYRGKTFWVSYVFTLAGFVVGIVSAWIGFVKQPNARSKFYGFPILKIGVLYALIQIIAGFLFMALGKWIPVWIVLILCAVAMAVAIIGLVSADTVVNQINNQDNELKKNVQLMRELQSKVMQLPGLCKETEVQNAIRKLGEDFRFSDPVSSDALIQIENDLSSAVYDLQDAVTESDWTAAKQICANVSDLLKERNRQCKLNK